MEDEIAKQIYKSIQIDSVSTNIELVALLMRYNSFPLSELIEMKNLFNRPISYKVAANAILSSSLFHDSLITSPTN